MGISDNEWEASAKFDQQASKTIRTLITKGQAKRTNRVDYTQGNHDGLLSALTFCLATTLTLAKAHLDRFEAIYERLEALEANGIKYVGTYQRAQSYRKGDVVTADGSMWVALRNTADGEQPGKVQDAWQLAQKGRA